ncbi:hypothetical protein [Gilvimarinus xylanilyticus]|uniref:ApeI dehydratase-like domain-containing protein n=1 Tax=Gilvimarinus xylanilyticus TaxID=2944139 RepID=A0A9X2KX07_9GAMM|nr:hypothetical protein [Gilvimarinus xylanilyticus]MCP8900150.1 hypothetical protein [Gilvimarinus xylanilyticus]
MSDKFRVAKNSPCVQGHFPDGAIVPGAYLLAQVHASFSDRFAGHELAELKKVKFIAPVLPGEAVTLSWDDSKWPAVKVVLQVADQVRLQASGRAV